MVCTGASPFLEAFALSNSDLPREHLPFLCPLLLWCSVQRENVDRDNAHKASSRVCSCFQDFAWGPPIQDIPSLPPRWFLELLSLNGYRNMRGRRDEGEEENTPNLFGRPSLRRREVVADFSGWGRQSQDWMEVEVISSLFSGDAWVMKQSWGTSFLIQHFFVLKWLEIPSV